MKYKGAVGIWLLFLFLLAGLSHSCGNNQTFLTKADQQRYYRKNFSATQNNIPAWISLWDGESWMVGLKPHAYDTVSGKPEKGALRSQIIEGFSQFYLPSLSFSQQEIFREQLARGLEIQTSYSPLRGLTKVGLEAADDTEWYALVRMEANNPLWENLLSRALPPLPIPRFLLQELAQIQFQALETLPDFTWVEPNLENQLNNGSGNDSGCKKETTTEKRPAEWHTTGPDCETVATRTRQIFTRIKWNNAEDGYQKYLASNPQIAKREVRVAVLDTGVDFEHPRLKARMFRNPDPKEIFNGIDDDGNGFIDDVYGFNASLRDQSQPDYSYQAPGAADVGGPNKDCPPAEAIRDQGGTCGHGTHVAGIIAAVSSNEIGTSTNTVLGVCDACKIFSVRGSKACVYPASTETGRCVSPGTGAPPEGSYIANGQIDDWSQVVGLNYLLNFTEPGTKDLYISIVNLSIGKYFYNRTTAAALSKIANNGILVIAAAGNNNTETPMFPAAYDSTIAVCATSEPANDPASPGARRGEYGKADFSNFGDWIDVCAPGYNIYSTKPGDQTEALSGTSMAAPLVAGAAGYILSTKIGTVGENRFVALDAGERIKKFADPSNLYASNNFYNTYYGDSIGVSTNYLLGTGFLDIEKALLGPELQSRVSAVYGSKGSDVAVPSGCVVSTIGLHNGSIGRPYRPMDMVDIFTTMPLVALQFLGGMALFKGARRRAKNPMHS